MTIGLSFVVAFSIPCGRPAVCMVAFGAGEGIGALEGRGFGSI